MVLGLQIVGDFCIVIALPVVVFVLIGQRLDGKFGTSPWCTVAAFALAAVISGKIIYKKAKYYASRYQEVTSDKQSKQNKP